jgi:hypothetical protein
MLHQPDLPLCLDFWGSVTLAKIERPLSDEARPARYPGAVAASARCAA